MMLVDTDPTDIKVEQGKDGDFVDKGNIATNSPTTQLKLQRQEQTVVTKKQPTDSRIHPGFGGCDAICDHDDREGTVDGCSTRVEVTLISLSGITYTQQANDPASLSTPTTTASTTTSPAMEEVTTRSQQFQSHRKRRSTDADLRHSSTYHDDDESWTVPKYSVTVAFSGSVNDMQVGSSAVCPMTGHLVVESRPIEIKEVASQSTTTIQPVASDSDASLSFSRSPTKNSNPSPFESLPPATIHLLEAEWQDDDKRSDGTTCYRGCPEIDELTEAPPAPHLTVQLPRRDPRYPKATLRCSNRDSNIIKEYRDHRHGDADTQSTDTELTSSTFCGGDHLQRKREETAGAGKEGSPREIVSNQHNSNSRQQDQHQQEDSPRARSGMILNTSNSSGNVSFLSTSKRKEAEQTTPQTTTTTKTTTEVGGALSSSSPPDEDIAPPSAVWSNSGAAMPEIIELSIRFKSLDHHFHHTLRRKSDGNSTDARQTDPVILSRHGESGEMQYSPQLVENPYIQQQSDCLEDGVAFLVVFGHEDDQGTVVMDLPIRKPRPAFATTTNSTTSSSMSPFSLTNEARLRIEVKVLPDRSPKRVPVPYPSLLDENDIVHPGDYPFGHTLSGPCVARNPRRQRKEQQPQHDQAKAEQTEEIIQYTKSMVENEIGPLMAKIIENEELARNHRLAVRRAMSIRVPANRQGRPFAHDAGDGQSFQTGVFDCDCWTWSQLYATFLSILTGKDVTDNRKDDLMNEENGVGVGDGICGGNDNNINTLHRLSSPSNSLGEKEVNIDVGVGSANVGQGAAACGGVDHLMFTTSPGGVGRGGAAASNIGASSVSSTIATRESWGI